MAIFRKNFVFVKKFREKKLKNFGFLLMMIFRISDQSFPTFSIEKNFHQYHSKDARRP